MKDSYSNPFSGVNAVQLEIDKILEYWCNPFNYDLFSEIKEEDIYTDPMNIVFMGGRSTGKSMFLRYWSFPVQYEKCKKENKPLLETIQKLEGIGYYFRIDGPILRSFQGKGLTEEQWGSIFTHYFELVVGRQILESIYILIYNQEIDQIKVNQDFIPQINTLIGTDGLELPAIIQEFDFRIKEVDNFRGNVSFNKSEFHPKTQGFSSQTLSIGVPEIIIKYIPELININIILLLDEYENFLEYQQKVINTQLRFSKPKIKFRLGMRLEGFRTFQMIADEDFIKEGREYRKVVFEEVLNKDKGYHDFLIEISKKRLESIMILKEKGFTDIQRILSDKEDLEGEARQVVKNNPDKLATYFSKKIPKAKYEKLRIAENPLYELLNFIWVLRGESVENTYTAMSDFINKVDSEGARKYRLDYVDKYKLSLLILLCSIYQTNKQYYSFNTFAFLSSGIVGHFIELCRRSFAIADWGDNEKLLEQGVISNEHQTKAALDFSIAEKQQINRIEKYGSLISKFIDNLGNIFKDFHRDHKIRYPETNQFAINLDSITDGEIKNALKSALKWSVIQKKPKMQRTGPDKQHQHLQDTYTINRIFSPVFQISYRTRGGKSILLNELSIKQLMHDDKIDSSKFLSQDTKDLSPNLFSEI